MNAVVLDGYSLNPGDLNWDGLASLSSLKVYDRTAPEDVEDRIAEAHAVFTNKALVSGDAIRSAKHLQYIGVLATGYNIVDVEAAAKKGVVVSNVPGYGTASVVQLSFALLLELCLRVERHSEAVHEGRWSSNLDFCFWDYPLTELSGKTMGIIGLGTIGRGVAKVARAFGMEVLANSRTMDGDTGIEGVDYCGLDYLLKNSDVVSLHCPLTPETHEIIDHHSLSLMKHSAFLINTSRGPLIQEPALATALNTGRIAGAGLDVLCQEPPRHDNPLLSARNCIITPHIAWASAEARKRLMDGVVDNFRAFAEGHPKNRVAGT